jgi:LacI family transcriptional regulator
MKTHRLLLSGILKFVHLHVPWLVHIEEGRYGEYRLRHLGEWGCTGIISCDPATATALAAFSRRTKTPMVVQTDDFKMPRSPFIIGNIRCDNVALAEAAAAYYLRAGFRRFAYVGEINHMVWSRERGSVFARKVQEAGYECLVYPDLSDAERGDAAVGLRNLGRWLKSLPKPIALFAAYDVRARQALDICLQNGIAVPDEVAILGIDDDEAFCETSFPPLSSIPMNCEEAGVEAGRLLDKAMREGVCPETPAPIVYTGTNVIERESTRPCRVTDPLTRRCLDLIELNIGSDLRVGDLASCLGISKRSLETRILSATGKTVIDQINATRVRRAQALLAETDMSGDAIAGACGFCDAPYFANVFRRIVGITPRSYRRNRRG